VLKNLLLKPPCWAPAAEEPAAEAPEAKYGLFMSHMTNAFTIEMSDAVKAKAVNSALN
jgi:hypothetical protein